MNMVVAAIGLAGPHRRVVADTDILRPDIRSISNRDQRGLPAPDGDDNTNINPRRSLIEA